MMKRIGMMMGVVMMKRVGIVNKGWLLMVVVMLAMMAAFSAAGAEEASGGTSPIEGTSQVDGSSETSGASSGQGNPGLPQITFKDLTAHWAKAAIEQAVQKGYVKGYPDGTFKPNNTVSRAEFIKMMSDSLHLQTAAVTGSWYTPYVSALKDAALLRDGDLAADLTKPMTRLEMSKLLVRGSDDSVRGKSLSDGEWLYRVTTAGLIGGMTDGTLNEKGTTTRAEATVVIERLYTKRSGGVLPVDKNAVSNAAILFKGTNLEETLGTKPIALPTKINFGPEVDVTLDKMIVIDLDDPKAPYRNKLKTLKSVYDFSYFTKNAYVVAFHFNLKTVKLSKGLWSFNGNKIDPSTYITQYHWLYNNVNPNEDILPVVPVMDLTKMEQKDGWYLIAVSKDFLERNSFRKDLVLFNGYTQDFIPFTTNK